VEELVVKGPTALRGEVRLPGAKNSVSKLLAASMLACDGSRFTNVPDIGDTAATLDICVALGALPRRDGRTVAISTPAILSTEVPEALARRNRLAVMMIAPLLHRAGAAVVPAAGGDRIGARPVDFHIEAYRAMGASVEPCARVHRLECRRLRGADFTLPYPSVTATESVLMAASLAAGTTRLGNAAVEPEVLDLALFLEKMGAHIRAPAPGAQDRTFVIEGVRRLSGASHAVMPDRLVAASLGAAAVASGGDVFVRGARQADLAAFVDAMRRAGARVETADDGVRFARPAGGGRLRPILVQTGVHPGFMTDWQPPMAVVLLQAGGESIIHETVFEDRLGYLCALRAMGADVELTERCLGSGECRFDPAGGRGRHVHSAVIRGPGRLRGATIDVPDLRAGFCHLIAAITAEGTSRLRGVEHLDRGYERIDRLLAGLGADIERAPA
jgi:UDP-N-acetylglucosamine 1-carboxyvinyltransferase